MDTALFLSAILMGLAGSPHCLAMCGAPSAALIGACGRGALPRLAWSSFHLGRLLSYGLAGAAVSGSVGAFREWSAWSPLLRPFWTMLHVAALGLGAYLALYGRQPAWLSRGLRPALSADTALEPGWQRMRGPSRALFSGGLWALWPCGLLQSALLVAALANSAAAGAMVMLGFALASALGLGVAPVFWARLKRLQGAQEAKWGARIIRFSGIALASASLWALGHGLWLQLAAYCLG